MNVDPEALATIRTIRARTDPILIRTPGNGLTIRNEPLPDIVVEERVDQIRDLSTERPRRVATWGETVYHLQENSLRDSIFVRDYRLAVATIFAFERFTEQHDIPTPELPMSWSQLTSCSDEALNELFKHTETSAAQFEESAVMKTLTQIRHALVWEQHQIFLNTLYEELPSELTDAVPRAFWKRADPILPEVTDGDCSESSSQQSESRSQTSLQDY